MDHRESHRAAEEGAKRFECGCPYHWCVLILYQSAIFVSFMFSQPKVCGDIHGQYVRPTERMQPYN